MQTKSRVFNLVTSNGLNWLLFGLAVLLLNWPLLGIGSAVAGGLWRVCWLLGVWIALIGALAWMARTLAHALGDEPPGGADGDRPGEGT